VSLMFGVYDFNTLKNNTSVAPATELNDTRAIISKLNYSLHHLIPVNFVSATEDDVFVKASGRYGPSDSNFINRRLWPSVERRLNRSFVVSLPSDLLLTTMSKTADVGRRRINRSSVSDFHTRSTPNNVHLQIETGNYFRHRRRRKRWLQLPGEYHEFGSKFKLVDIGERLPPTTSQNSYSVLADSPLVVREPIESRWVELVHTGHCHENTIIINEHFQFYYQVGTTFLHPPLGGIKACQLRDDTPQLGVICSVFLKCFSM